MLLAGKKVVVVGGSSGIGLAAAIKFAEAGAITLIPRYDDQHGVLDLPCGKLTGPVNPRGHNSLAAELHGAGLADPFLDQLPWQVCDLLVGGIVLDRQVQLDDLTDPQVAQCLGGGLDRVQGGTLTMTSSAANGTTLTLTATAGDPDLPQDRLIYSLAAGPSGARGAIAGVRKIYHTLGWAHHDGIAGRGRLPGVAQRARRTCGGIAA